MGCGRAAVWRLATAAFFALGVGAGDALGQDEERRLERLLRRADEQEHGLLPDTGLALTERLLVDVGGYHTFTFLNLNDDRANHRRLLQYDTTLYGRVSLDGAQNAFVRARFRYLDFSPGDSFDGRGDRWAEPFLDRYWYEFDLRRYMSVYQGREIDGDLSVRVGRQFVDWGAGLALSEQLYAVRPAVRLGQRWAIEGLAGVTPGDESIVDFDASREDFQTKTRRGFFGGILRFSAPWGQDLYGYGLYMHDYNTDTTARFGTTGPVDFRYNAAYVGAGLSGSIGGNLLYLGEAVYEFGWDQSDPLRGTQVGTQIRAVAARGQVTYLFRDANHSQAQAETLVASGDADRQLPSDTVGGNLPGTIDTGFNGLGFANTGLAFAPALSNIVTVRLGASTFPFPEVRAADRLQVGLDTLAFFKYNHNAAIDEPTDGSSSYLGTELDLFMNYRVTSDLALSVRYGVFFPGKAITGQLDARNFVMFAATISF